MNLKEAVEAEKPRRLCQKMRPRRGSVVVGIKQGVAMATRFAGMTLNLAGSIERGRGIFWSPHLPTCICR